MILFLILFPLAFIFEPTIQHGYLANPPSRASAWLEDSDFLECCKNYDYNQMFCGGFRNQWENNGGKCGICGDPYEESHPRTYEKGGSKYLGKIVRTYKKNSEIPVEVILTANHWGFFEFRICKVDGWETDATESCLNRTKLRIKEASGTKFPVSSHLEIAHLSLILPENFVCSHCVLQWKYVTGNSWGRDPETNTECVGCGPVQENFIGCSDIAILGDGTEIEEVTSTTTTTSTSTSTTSLTTTTSTATTTLSSIEIIDPIFTTINPFYIEELTTPYEMTSVFIPVGTTTAEIPTEYIDYSITETDDDSYEYEFTTTQTMSTTTTESSKIPGGSCRVKYEFGTKINIARIVKIYCNRMCKVRCKVILDEFEKSVRQVVSLDVIACLETCPALCDCP